jgi:hypothetical protein
MRGGVAVLHTERVVTSITLTGIGSRLHELHTYSAVNLTDARAACAHLLVSRRGST